MKRSKIFNAAKELIYPLDLTCNLCGREVFGGEAFCEKCKPHLVLNDGAICAACGRSSPNPTVRCSSCRGGWEVDTARSLFIYEDEVPTVIKRYKYGGNRYIARLFIDRLVEIFIRSDMAAEVIVWVPMTEERLFERGFNHSEELARLLSEAIGVETGRVLIKKRETERQAGLDRAARQKNLKGAFAVVDKAAVAGKTVLIVDDVLTTGATSGELARILKKAGAKRVCLLTLASAKVKI